MKKLITMILLLTFATACAWAEPLPGLDRLPADAEATLAEYSSGTKLERGFVTDDREEVRQLLEAVKGMEITGTTDEFVTDMYPVLSIYFSDGTEYSLRFDGKWLELDGKNHILANDAPFWALIDALADKYADLPQTPFQPNCTDIYLPANPTTGYAWQFQVDTPDVVSVADQYFADGQMSDAVGGGGVHWFHFDGLHPGTASVMLFYARPWEETADTALVFRVTVDEQLNVLIWGVEMNGN